MSFVESTEERRNKQDISTVRFMCISYFCNLIMGRVVLSNICSICLTLYIGFPLPHKSKLLSVHREVNSAESDCIISEISWVCKILFSKFIPWLLLSFTPTSLIQGGLPQNVTLHRE